MRTVYPWYALCVKAPWLRCRSILRRMKQHAESRNITCKEAEWPKIPELWSGWRMKNQTGSELSSHFTMHSVPILERLETHILFFYPQAREIMQCAHISVSRDENNKWGKVWNAAFKTGCSVHANVWKSIVSLCLWRWQRARLCYPDPSAAPLPLLV